MDPRIKAALAAPYPHWPLIVVAGTGPAVVHAAGALELRVPVLIVALALQIVIFGRILAQVLPERSAAFREILKEHSLRFMVAGFLVGVARVVMHLMAVRVLVPALPPFLVSGFVTAVVAVAAIYIWPLVFLQRSSVAAIPGGVSYLAHNFTASLWIAGIVVVGQIVRTVGHSVYVEYRSGWGFVILLTVSVVSTYAVVAAYAGALYTLLQVRVAGVR